MLPTGRILLYPKTATVAIVLVSLAPIISYGELLKEKGDESPNISGRRCLLPFG